MATRSHSVIVFGVYPGASRGPLEAPPAFAGACVSMASLTQTAVPRGHGEAWQSGAGHAGWKKTTRLSEIEVSHKAGKCQCVISGKVVLRGGGGPNPLDEPTEALSWAPFCPFSFVFNWWRPVVGKAVLHETNSGHRSLMVFLRGQLWCRSRQKQRQLSAGPVFYQTTTNVILTLSGRWT